MHKIVNFRPFTHLYYDTLKFSRVTSTISKAFQQVGEQIKQMIKHAFNVPKRMGTIIKVITKLPYSTTACNGKKLRFCVHAQQIHISEIDWLDMYTPLPSIAFLNWMFSAYDKTSHIFLLHVTFIFTIYTTSYNKTFLMTTRLRHPQKNCPPLQKQHASHGVTLSAFAKLVTLYVSTRVVSFFKESQPYSILGGKSVVVHCLESVVWVNDI